MTSPKFNSEQTLSITSPEFKELNLFSLVELTHPGQHLLQVEHPGGHPPSPCSSPLLISICNPISQPFAAGLIQRCRPIPAKGILERVYYTR